MQTVARNHLIE